MEILINKILLYLNILSIVFIVYYVIRLIHLLVGLKNNKITENNFGDIKNDLLESSKLKILWFSISYIFFYMFI
jgi:hypothetical protein